MAYHTYETAANLLLEQRAADRLARHWRGRCLTTEQYESFDRRLIEPDGRTAALVEIKVRNYDIEFMVTHQYLLSLSKVKSLLAAAKRRAAVPLVMVVCTDDDFLLDLRDETGQNLRRLPMNDRQHDHHTGEPVMRDEWLVAFSGARFLPLFTLPSLL